MAPIQSYKTSWKIKQFLDKHGDYSVVIQGHNKNTIAYYCESNDIHHWPDGTTEDNICINKATKILKT